MEIKKIFIYKLRYFLSILNIILLPSQLSFLPFVSQSTKTKLTFDNARICNTPWKWEGGGGTKLLKPIIISSVSVKC